MSQGFPGNPAQPNMGPPPSSGGRSVLWIILGILGVSGLLCCGICGVGSYFIGRVAMSVLSAQAQAQTAIENDREAMAKLGKPVHFGPVEDVKILNSDASFTFPTNGSKTSGKAVVKAVKKGDDWEITQLEVQCNDGTVLKINHSSSSDPTNINLPEIEDQSEEMKEEKK